MRKILELPTPILSILAIAIGLLLCTPLFYGLSRLAGNQPAVPVPVAAPAAVEPAQDAKSDSDLELATIRQRDADTVKQAILAKLAERAKQATAEEAAVEKQAAAERAAAEQAAIIAREDLVDLTGIARRYDKFGDYISFALKCGTITRSNQTMSIYLTYIISGNKPRSWINPYRDIHLLFISSATEWQYLKYHDLTMVTGDYRVPLKTKFDGEVRSNNEFMVSESISVDIPGFELRELLDRCAANGKEIEIQLGIDELPIHYPINAGQPQPTSTLRRDLERFLAVIRSERLMNKLPER